MQNDPQNNVSIFTDSELNQATSLKQPPHSIDAEQAVIGGVLMDGTVIDDVLDIVGHADFYRKEHRAIFESMEGMAAKDILIDLTTLVEELDNQNKFNEIGGFDYVADLLGTTPSIVNIQAYSQIVKDRAVLRSLISAANTIADNSYNPEGRSVEQIVDHAQSLIIGVDSENSTGDEIVKVGSLSKKLVDLLDERSKSKTGLIGVSTGFLDIDGAIRGLPKSDLIIIAGRPSMGKTAFALNLAENVAKANELTIFFSAEMPKDDLLLRTYSNLGNIPNDVLRSGQLNSDQWSKLTTAVNLVSKLPLYIDDTNAIKLAQIRSRTRKAIKAEGKPVGAIFIDYLQLMGDEGDEFGGEDARLSKITRGLKSIAKEFECPVIALSQLNRGLEKRPNKRPVMSDLRSSGAIEQDADIIMFVYRDEVYNKDTTAVGIAEIDIAKQRNGVLRTCKVEAELNYMRFKNTIKSESDSQASQETYQDGFDYE